MSIESNARDTQFDSAESMSPTIQDMQDFQRQQSQLQGYPNQLYHGYYATPGQFAQGWPATAWMTATATTGSTSPEHTSTSTSTSSAANSSPNSDQESSAPVHQLQMSEQSTQGTEQEQQIYSHPQMNHLLTQQHVYHPQAFQVTYLPLVFKQLALLS